MVQDSDNDITRFRDGELDATIAHLELAIDRMDIFCQAIPVPLILYSTRDLILWYNEPMAAAMRGDFGLGYKLASVPNPLHMHVSEALPGHVAKHILENNARVRASGMPQYDHYDHSPDNCWDCFRFPVQTTRVGSILLPPHSIADYFKPNKKE